MPDCGGKRNPLGVADTIAVGILRARVIEYTLVLGS